MGGDERAALLRLAPSLLVLVAPTLPALQLYVLSVPCCADPSYSTSYLYFLSVLPGPRCLPSLSSYSLLSASSIPLFHVSICSSTVDFGLSGHDDVPHWSIWVLRCRVWPIPSSYSYLHVFDDIFQFPIPASSGRSLPAPNLMSAHRQSPPPPCGHLSLRRQSQPYRKVAVSLPRSSACHLQGARPSERPRCRRPQSQPYRKVAVSLSRSSACHLQGAPSFRSAPLPSPNFFHRPTDRCGRRPFQIPALPVPYLCVPTMDESPR